MFERKIKIHNETNGFILKTIENSQELEKVLEFRFNIFYKELLNEHREGRDIDEFDIIADHLVLIDKRDRKIIGNYRLISSTFSRNLAS